MTREEYKIRMKIYPVKRVEAERDIYLLAYLTNRATATVKKGKDIVSAYPSFDDFYDYKSRLKEVSGISEIEEPRKLTSLESLILEATSQGGG